MNVIDALHACSLVRACKPDPVGKDPILKILKAAAPPLHGLIPSRGAIFVARGEALERLSTAYVSTLSGTRVI